MGVRFAKKIRFGNMEFGFYVDSTFRKSFFESTRGIANSGLSKKPVSYRVDLIGLDKSDGIRLKNRRWMGRFFKNYVQATGFKDLNKNQARDLLKAFFVCTKYEKVYRSIYSIKGTYGKDFMMLAVDSKTLLMANLRKRRALIITARRPYWKRNSYLYNYAIYLLANFFASTAASFVLHSSAVSINGRGYVFVGESGAGKTTVKSIILKKLKSARMLSDDFIIVVYEKGSFNAYRLVLDKTKGFGRRITTKMSIDFIYFIQKSEYVSVRKITLRKALQEILKRHLPNKYWFERNALPLPRLVSQFLTKSSFSRLYFRKDSDFINNIIQFS